MHKKFYSIPKGGIFWGLSFRWNFNILIVLTKILWRRINYHRTGPSGNTITALQWLNLCKHNDNSLANLCKHNNDIPVEILCDLNHDNPVATIRKHAYIPVVTLCKHNNDNPLANLHKHSNDIPMANLCKLNDDIPSFIHYGNLRQLIEYQRLMKNSAPSI